jgi:hypothetical protein
MPTTQSPPPDGGSLLSADDPWVGYLRIAVEISRAPQDVLVVRAGHEGQTGSWPFPDPRPVHVMTAWDPGDERPGVETNRRRQAALEEELKTLAETTPLSTWPTSGCDPETGYRDEGVAVTGMREVDARALAARYRQEAIFTWTPHEWAIVACAGARRVNLGWTLESPDLGRAP